MKQIPKVLLLHPVINRLLWEMLDLVFVLDLKNYPAFASCGNVLI